MHEFKIKIKRSYLEKAMLIVAVNREKYLVLEESKRELMTAEATAKWLLRGGSEAREEAIENINTRIEAYCDVAVSKVKALHRQMIAFLDSQTAITGDMIKGESEDDFNMLKYGLIESEEKLHEFMEKETVKNNPALRLACTNYAKDHFCEPGDSFNIYNFKWDDKKEEIYEYINEIFEGIVTGASKPDGYWAMWCEGENTLEKSIVERGYYSNME